MGTYSEAMKSKMVQRMLVSGGPSPERLSGEVGISKSTLFKWREAAKVQGTMTIDRKPLPADRRPEDWTATEKLDAVMDSSQLQDEALGTFLRSKGLYEAQLHQWRQAALDGLSNNGVKGTQGQAAARVRVRELEREVQRKDKALAETAAILMLQKKVRGLWEVADGGTDPESDK
jgi:transposase